MLSLERQLVRQQRMVAQLERMISPEATYPVVGRSIVYRFGAFHALSQIALLDKILLASFQRTSVSADSCYAEADIYARYF